MLAGRGIRGTRASRFVPDPCPNHRSPPFTCPFGPTSGTELEARFGTIPDNSAQSCPRCLPILMGGVQMCQNVQEWSRMCKDPPFLTRSTKSERETMWLGSVLTGIGRNRWRSGQFLLIPDNLAGIGCPASLTCHNCTDWQDGPD